MPRAWTKKQERQYKHIVAACRKGRGRRSLKTCQRIAAATVNKHRLRLRRRRIRRILRPRGVGVCDCEK